MSITLSGSAAKRFAVRAFCRSDRRKRDPCAIAVRFIDSTSAAEQARDHESGSPAALAHALLSFEAEFEAERPEAIVLSDASDTALAAALVAAKLLIPVRATEDAIEAAGLNADLIAQLADAYTASA
jgi:hypothetical protein